MNNEQAKQILGSYRPNGEDAGDPFFSEALEKAGQDPELRSWFEEHRRFDDALRSAVRAEAAPPDLREKILAGRRVLDFPNAGARPKGVGSGRLTWSAMAAALLLLLGLGSVLLFNRQDPLTGGGFVREVVHLKQSGQIVLDRTGNDTEALRQWLAERGSPSAFPVPKNLETVGAIGCQTFTIKGRKVSLVCFQLDRDRIVHFFVIDSKALEDPPGPEPEFIESGNIASATWSSQGMTYVLLGKDVAPATLQRLI